MVCQIIQIQIQRISDNMSNYEISKVRFEFNFKIRTYKQILFKFLIKLIRNIEVNR